MGDWHQMVSYTSRAKSQQGSALITVVSLSIALFMVGALGSRLVIESTQNTQEEFRRRSQASNIARAGLQESIGWFKQRSVNGVGYVHSSTLYTPDMPCADAAFNPAYHDDLQQRETDDESIGIVKDIVLDSSSSLYGRYIIRKQPCRNTANNADILPGESDYDPLAVHDLTEEQGKGKRGEGVVWGLVSEGIVYQRNDNSRDGNGIFTTSPDESPNRILDRALVGVNLHRLSIRNPQAPINIIRDLNGTSPGASRFNSNCQVLGEAGAGGAQAGMIYSGANPTGSANIDNQFSSLSRGKVSAYVDSGSTRDYMKIEDVFSIDKAELRTMADAVITSQSELEKAYYKKELGAGHYQLPMAIYYLEGNYTFNASQFFRGNGVLFIDGNLTLNDDSFIFNGLLYVTGHLNVRSNNSVSGATFAGRMTCEPSNKTRFEYSKSMLARVSKALAIYREGAIRYVSH